MKELLKNPVVAIFAGLLGSLLFWFTYSYETGALVGALVPELIGFCLEGMFFVGIFSWLQERRETERKTELRNSLAGAVGFLCQVINSCLEDKDQILLASSDNWTRQARTNGTSLKALERKLRETDLKISQQEVVAIQQLFNTRTSTLDSLLSVSAQLSHAHLSAYSMILTEIHKIAEHGYFEEVQLKSSFSNLLRLLISFNKEAI